MVVMREDISLCEREVMRSKQKRESDPIDKWKDKETEKIDKRI